MRRGRLGRWLIDRFIRWLGLEPMTDEAWAEIEAYMIELSEGQA